MSNKNDLQRKTSGSPVRLTQKCVDPGCDGTFGLDEMLGACKQCGAKLAYDVEGTWDGKPADRKDLWKNFPVIPLEDPANIVSLGVGDSEILLLDELTDRFGGAKIHLQLDSEKNPTGTFKDREASIILSRCKELGLDNLVFYSTANTGRAYTHFAAQLGLTSYMFMPRQCAYKNTEFIDKKSNNHIIFVDSHYPQIGPFAKAFAKANGLKTIAPMHDRTESYATVAYEQMQKLPGCDFFVQTIASGMGPLGFYKGHLNMVKLGLQTKERIPRVVCVQSGEMNVMSRAYNSGRTELTMDDLPKEFPEDLYEPTLNSTNPVNNYPDLYKCLKENNGIITDVAPEIVKRDGQAIIDILKRRGYTLRPDLENSLLIEYAGLLKLAAEGTFKEGDVVLMLACGRGRDTTTNLIQPDLVIDPKTADPVDVFKRLNGK
jgi:threonine synthase